ncbi:uncharacterized protein LOC129216416 [Uloborus diversus]|uniref:uncharacterized protein LOC129216416 n=1 Tax=Uloborus diversus TaxID=327109 RepID=UPI0024093134|nr:uncharacterized protein LOC129216416 [Uloborus diversus]
MIMQYLMVDVLFLWCIVFVRADESAKSVSTAASVKKSDSSAVRASSKLIHKTGGYLGTKSEFQQRTNEFRDGDDQKQEIPKTPRGFADFVSGDDDSYNASPDEQTTRWSPYYIPTVRDSMYDSGSNPDWNVWKRDDERPFAKFSPEYADMLMMMQAMKKMDSNSGSRPGLLSRILDNPATLVMATFIPMSLLLAAALPLIMKVMMNGITIPALVTTASKGRGFSENDSPDFLGPILESLADFGSRYLDNPDCLQKIFCEMARDNTSKETSGAKYLKQAASAATFIVNEDLLKSFGIKSFVESIKNGKCDQLLCSKQSKAASPSLLNVINEAIFDHTMKNRPRLR